MTEPVKLSPHEYDPVQMATPLQLLHLLKRLGVRGAVIANWLGVTPAAVSQWFREKYPIPARHAPVLKMRARTALDQAWELNKKEVALQPTEDLQRATRMEFTSLYDRWKLEVLHAAGTLQRSLEQQCDELSSWVRKPPQTQADVEAITQACELIVVKAQLLVNLRQEQQEE